MKGHAEPLTNLESVLLRLQDREVQVRKDKCAFFQPQLEYLGHVIKGDGAQTSDTKVKALLGAPNPTDKQQLRSFLALINYYGKFIPQFSTVVQPMTRLLGAEVPWKWDKHCDEAARRSKELLSSAEVLTHYDADRPIQLLCDASSYGVGAVLSHMYPDGTPQLMAYASRTLNSANRNYSQLEKEAPALIFRIKSFIFVYGHASRLFTDHKPLQAIFGPKKGDPSVAASWLQR